MPRTTRPSRSTSRSRLVDQRVDALIVLPVDPCGDHWRGLADETVLVSIGDSLPGAATAAEVVFDNAWGVTEALTELAQAGHRRIAVLTPLSTSTPDRPAEAVVYTLAPQLGVTATLHTTPHDLDGACAVAVELLRRPDRPTAVLCLADSIAYGVYEAARILGLRIPDDVSVLGYDDRPVSRVLTPPLSTFHWPIDELVDTVVAAHRSRHRRRQAQPAQGLRPVPVPRGSVGPRTALTVKRATQPHLCCDHSQYSAGQTHIGTPRMRSLPSVAANLGHGRADPAGRGPGRAAGRVPDQADPLRPSGARAHR